MRILLRQGNLVRPWDRTGPDEWQQLPESQRLAAFALLQWCGGRPASLLQLQKDQLRQLAAWCGSDPVWFCADAPQKSLAPDHPFFSALHPSPEPTPPVSALPPGSEAISKPAPPSVSTGDLSPPVVDGSEHFVSIQLPSQEHPAYTPLVELVRAQGFTLETSNRRWWLRGRHKALSFWSGYLEQLRSGYGANFSANFQQNSRTWREPTLKTCVEESDTEQSFSLEASVLAEGFSPATIATALHSGREYLEDGTRILLLPASLRSDWQKVQEKLAPAGLAGRQYGATAKCSYPAVRGPEILSFLEEINPNLESPGAWRQRSRLLLEGVPPHPPPLEETLAKRLRPYQLSGVAWLDLLCRHGFGALLADEMGLGKTIQALALLYLYRTKAGDRPSLLVCPASLTENWRREALRFTPGIPVLLHHGRHRLPDWENLPGSCLVITSYGMLARERAFFARPSYQFVLADEAQHLRNRKTQHTRAILRLQAEHRILLTGTPVENHPDDLRTLFEFLHPGAWPQAPAGAQQEGRRQMDHSFLKGVAPYILRRTKSEVAKDLPPKLEQTLFVEMAEPQASAYRTLEERFHRELLDLAGSGASEGKQRLEALTRLLRLRQFCCDPRLVDPSSPNNGSAKLQAFAELMEEIMDGGHRVLVFSQFVQMLRLLAAWLEDNGLSHCWLDGSTRDRQAVCDRFNGDASIPVFLISLKAGGTGLNLTGADTVVHFDPWWNPAVQAQATDRAHRIGQTRVVTSYSLIAADSVEERVLALQQDKKRLLADVFEASAAAQLPLPALELRQLLKPDESSGNLIS